MLFSIIIPCYNLEKNISKTLDSVLNQTYKKFEVIIINDGSTDGTMEKVEFYKDKDPRVVVHDKINGGVSSARNYGLNNATGDYILFLDGDSKLQAEKELTELESENFKVVILRPPMIYGKGSKGNYPLLSKFAQKSPIFPDYPNKRSILHVDNLCELLRILIQNNESGMFHPQNKTHVQTSEMVRLISEHHNHKIYFSKSSDVLINLLLKINLIKKVFGDLYYEESMSFYNEGNYQIRTLKESIKLTESVN